MTRGITLGLLAAIVGAALTVAGASAFPVPFARVTGHMMVPVNVLAGLVARNRILEEQREGRCADFPGI